MVRLWSVIMTVVAVLAMAPAAAAQGKRIALVITNQNYTQPGARLTNTHRDGDLLKGSLEAVGFSVTVVRDARNEAQLTAAIAAHVARLSAAGPDAVGFLYYSGHGAADRPNGENYLIPTEAPLTHVNQLPLLAVKLEKITEALARTGRMSFLVFDACRNVPLERDDKSLTFKGFAPVREQGGLLVAFATEPGNVAVDQSLYARVLAEEIVRPGIEASQAFRAVTRRVSQETGSRQSPEYLDKRRDDFQFAAVVVPPPPLPAAAAPQAGTAELLRLCREVAAISSFATLDAMKRQHAGTPVADCISARMAELGLPMRAPASPSDPPVTTTAADERLVFATAEQLRAFAAAAPASAYFSTDARITPQAEATLRRQIDWLKQNRVTFTIEGHDDGRTGAAVAHAIGMQRAVAVRDFMVANGIAAARIQVSSLGNRWPAATCGDESCWAQNRRTRTVIDDGARPSLLAGLYKPPAPVPAPSGSAPPDPSLKRDPAANVAPGSGQGFKDRLADGSACTFCPEMVVVPSGRFTMGSPASEPERGSGEAQVPVTITRPFAVGRFAVTFDEWHACVADGGCNGYTPKDEGWGRGKRPVINVNWDDAKAYVAWLSAKTSKTYRLLWETEREYVTRAGTTTPFWWGASITPVEANYDGNYTYGGGSKGVYRQRTVPVDSFQPNPWGLYNVHGNVWEWVEDCWNESNSGHPGDGSARTSGDCSRRVVRGGSWGNDPRRLRAASRYRYSTDSRNYILSFRVGRTF